ncbi:terminase small subunit, partial [Escherichia coli]
TQACHREVPPVEKKNQVSVPPDDGQSFSPLSGIDYMEDGLPDPVKAMGRILVENISIDPKLALDAAWR